MNSSVQIQTQFTGDKAESSTNKHKDSYKPPFNIFLKKSDENIDKLTVLKEIGLMILFFIVYSIAGKLGLKLAYENASATAIWAPTGIALTVFLLRGYHMWPAIFLGAFLINITTTWDFATSFCIAFGNTMEGLLGAYLVNKYANGKYAFEKPQTIFKFFFLAGILSTAVSATIGVTSLAVFGFAEWSTYFSVWFTWWIGDAVGDFLIAPLLIMWILNPRIRWRKKRIIEAGCLFITLLLINLAEFHDLFIDRSAVISGLKIIPKFVWVVFSFPYLIIPPFVWIAYRFPQRAVATVVFVFCGFAVWATLEGAGPFRAYSPNDSLILLQIFMSVLTVMSIGFSSVISERMKAEQSLKEAHDKLDERVKERTAVLNAVIDELQREISERRRVQKEIEQKNALVKLLQEIAVEANQSLNVEEILKFAIDKICEFTSWPIGHLYMAEKPDSMIPAKIWNTGLSPEYSNFKKLTEATNFKNKIGLPGRILDSGKPVWIPDVNKDDNFPRAKVATEIKIKAAFGFPILSENEVVGVLEFFAPEAHEPDENILEIMYNIGTQLGRVVERQRSIETIRKNEARFRAVSETANDAIISADSTGNIYYFNKSAENMLGYLHGEVLGEPLTILMPERYRKMYQTGFSHYLETSQSRVIGRTVELSGLRKNGEEFPIELSLSQWEANGEIHFTGMIRDITDRKKAEEQIISSEKQLKYAQYLAHVGSFEWDVAQNIVTWSDELYHIYGLKPDEFDGTYETFLSFLHPVDRDRIKRIIEECYKLGKSFVMEERIIRPDGNVRILQTYGNFIMDEKRNVTKMIGACQDVTEAKEAEEELRNTYEKLKQTQNELINSEKLASLGRFSSGIAHEIRNPLANISALAQIISKSKIDKGMKKHLKYIIANVDIANKIIKDLLDFASPHEVELEKGHISKVIDNLYKIVKTRCDRNKIHLTKKISRKLPLIMLNEKKLQTAFLNFISNAIDAMPGGGKLKIAAGMDGFTNEIVITFEDTGVGIKQDDVDKIFEPFFTTKADGTGLGLSLAYQVIRAHSGKLDISSKEKQGTKIVIRLPLNNEKAGN